MENTNLQDLFNSLGFSEEEQQEVSAYSFQTEGEIDDAIQAIKELDEDEERFKALHKEQADKLKSQLDSKLNKIAKKREWLLFNLKNSVMQSSDKKETKTQFKKNYLAGDIVITKSKTNLIKPELTEEEIKDKFSGYVKEKNTVSLDWAELKKDLKIVDGKVIDMLTGRDLSSIISTEWTSESVSVK